MAEPISPFDPFFEKIREIVREELKAAIAGNGHPPKEWMKAEDLAKEYGQPKTWFEERGRAGDIARSKSGRYVLFKRRDVEAHLEQHCKKEPIVRKKKKKETNDERALDITHNSP